MAAQAYYLYGSRRGEDDSPFPSRFPHRVFLKFFGIEVTKNNHNVQGFIFFTQFSENQSQEWERPKPGRRPDIFPQFSPMKTPLPLPLPADPPEEDEEEEEKKEEEEEDPEKEEPDNPEKPASFGV